MARAVKGKSKVYSCHRDESTWLKAIQTQMYPKCTPEPRREEMPFRFDCVKVGAGDCR